MDVKPLMRQAAAWATAVLAALFLISPAWAAKNDRGFSDLTELSIEQLMNIEITTAGRKNQRLSETAAAVFVITQEDIRRSGATTIPDLLRMVPGLQVARIDGNKWAVTARGFNGRFANKLLVLMDGRSVYSPLFSGVIWDVQDTMLEDIDRIEVIRGPGASVWGANAVNGVINIITKPASETQGGLVAALAGTVENGNVAARYGGTIGKTGAYRLYGKYFDRDGGVDAMGDDTPDDWHAFRTGFRTDWQPNPFHRMTLQGDLYKGRSGERLTYNLPTLPFAATDDVDEQYQGGNLLGRWTCQGGTQSETVLQFYYDRTHRNFVLTEETRDIFDLDVQHRTVLMDRHEIQWGAGWRITRDDLTNTFPLTFTELSRTDNLFSAFVQDEIRFFDDKVRVTLGSKFEHNDYTGFEVQPSARALWAITGNHSVWAAVSRAVRTPARAEQTARYNLQVFPLDPANPFGPTATFSVSGNSDFVSEDVIAYEAGYRVNLYDRLSVDITGFYNRYHDVRSTNARTPVPWQLDMVNAIDGNVYGVEAAADSDITDWWRLKLAYTYIQIDLDPSDIPIVRGDISVFEGDAPKHQLSMRSLMSLGERWNLDGWIRYVDALPSQNVDAYTVLDLRLGWQAAKNLEMAVVGRNLLDSRHAEYIPEGIDVMSTEVPRSVYGKITWTF